MTFVLEGSYISSTTMLGSSHDSPGWCCFRNRWVVFSPLALQQSINFTLNLHTVFVVCLENLKKKVWNYVNKCRYSSNKNQSKNKKPLCMLLHIFWPGMVLYCWRSCQVSEVEVHPVQENPSWWKSFHFLLPRR